MTNRHRIDRVRIETLFGIMHRLRRQGISSILISHKLDEVFSNADRVTVMRDGKVIRTHVHAAGDGAFPSGGFDRNAIITDMVGRSITNFYPVARAKIGPDAMSIENFTVPHPYNSDKRIVENVSFTVAQGEILGLAGLVGAGRSELVNALFGITRKTSGTIRMDGGEVLVHQPSDAIRARIALVTEDRKRDGFVPLMNIHENITLASLRRISHAGSLDRKAELQSAQAFFIKLGIKAPDMHSRLYALSGGNQQKVVLSKWLMTSPRILILDEPTRGIDIGTKTEIYSIMRELTDQGIAIIMISSELPELLSMSDRIAVLSGGKLSGIVDRQEATQERIMYLATRFMSGPEEDAATDCQDHGGNRA